jgi:hypothetical protein
MRAHSAGKAGASPSADGLASETAAEEAAQPPEQEFGEPVAAEDREDPGTDIAPSRFEAPIDPHAPTRARSSESCSLADENMPEVDLDGTA